MLFEGPSQPPADAEGSDPAPSQARAEPRILLDGFRRSLLPSGSPFGWNARGRALYVQFLTALLMSIVTLSFVGFDGWPFLLEHPADDAALRAAKILSVAALAFWVALYVVTWLGSGGSRNGFSWLLAVTIAAHIVTGTSVCYALGPYSAASGLITVAALLLGMVLLRRRFLWIAVAAWLTSMAAIHFLSTAGILPFFSLAPTDVTLFAAERAAAAALIYIPLVIVMDHLISAWRQDERTLYEAAQLDSLTGAYTRGFAVAVMQRALMRAAEDDRTLAVLMVDLDHFKRINDAHGHAIGDSVLRQTTRAIQSTLRSDDIVGRFGGEEFVVLLPGADLEQAMGAAERCRVAVEKMQIPGAQYVSVTASVGVAAFPDHGDDLDVLLKASDEAMYEAKARGRNRIQAAGPT